MDPNLPSLPAAIQPVPVAATASTASSLESGPCPQTSLPPRATRLAAAQTYSDIHLTIVAANVQPRISARDAYAHLGYPYQPGPWNCGFTEFLADWSSDSPATMPADCVPNATQTPWSPPADCADITPMYQHVLAWVFTWREDCMPVGGAPVGPAGSQPPKPSYPPMSCRGITFVDANSGQPGFTAEGGF
jgi:hypothetical protein